MLTRQFSPIVTHKSRDKEKITAIYCLWMVEASGRGHEEAVVIQEISIQIGSMISEA